MRPFLRIVLRKFFEFSYGIPYSIAASIKTAKCFAGLHGDITVDSCAVKEGIFAVFLIDNYHFGTSVFGVWLVAIIIQLRFRGKKQDCVFVILYVSILPLWGTRINERTQILFVSIHAS